MLEYITKLKAWGNSLGIVVPKEQAEKEKLKTEQEIKVIITPKKVLKVKNIFGKLKDWKKPTVDIMREIDKDLDSKFLETS